MQVWFSNRRARLRKQLNSQQLNAFNSMSLQSAFPAPQYDQHSFNSQGEYAANGNSRAGSVAVPRPTAADAGRRLDPSPAWNPVP